MSRISPFPHLGEALRTDAPPALRSAATEVTAGLICKIADSPDEIEQIHRLNYRTFVEEIPQHSPNPERRLVDKFHHENTYLVVKHRARVVGMMALRDNRPFSMDAKIPDFDRYLPPHKSAVEIRLLAIEHDFRGRVTFRMMMDETFALARTHGWDLAVISATVRQLKLYGHMGFEPFAALVGTGDARFQPMYLRMAKAECLRAQLTELPGGAPGCPEVRVSLIPGPVPVSRLVRKAMRAAPLWHRSEAFHALISNVHAELCRLTGTRHCQIIPGSGTLANDMVAWQLRALGRPGCVLVNGEFGERIAAQARRAGLDCRIVSAQWGQPLDQDEVRRACAQLPAGSWVWGVHHETSTGILNPLHEWQALTDKHGLLLCADVISSIGNVALSLDRTYLATATSGKGLCGYPGLGIVFHRELLSGISRDMPSYLDIGSWEANKGVPFTHSSNLVAALAATLGEQDFSERPARLAALYRWLLDALKDTSFTVLASEACACPAIVTLVPRAGGNAWTTGKTLEKAGFLLSYRSAYLRARNWIQISLMGLPEKETLTELAGLLNGASNHDHSFKPEHAAR